MIRYSVTRLAGNPVIRPGMDARMGSNIQGPSVIRVPDWVRNPLGRYYCYFADHKGDYIRLAYADAPEGPWTVHAPGSLALADSLFPTTSPPVPANVEDGDRLPGRAPPGTPGIPDPMEDATHPHIASPDVHVDDANKRIVMYFHGLAGFRTQRSRVALSEDGLAFKALPDLLGPSYFRVFRHGGWTYALAMPGIVFRSKDGLTAFERGPTLFPGTQRHTALRLRGDRLEVFWTRVGDLPEAILLSEIDLTGDWMSWRAEGEATVLRPVEPWEGSNLPLAPSWRGAINAPVHQLRDPCILEDAGRVLLFYAVQGEAGIAVAELHDA
ncbi:hypothetical protein AAFN86_01575 [Roseomonas sp. CAU 1739]|uniref:hypothetical protein n=1 Tax=Roseomonas sp. CAU 1739 TaxID=3140364 RepID=UPI00325AD1BA